MYLINELIINATKFPLVGQIDIATIFSIMRVQQEVLLQNYHSFCTHTQPLLLYGETLWNHLDISDLYPSI